MRTLASLVFCGFIATTTTKVTAAPEVQVTMSASQEQAQVGDIIQLLIQAHATARIKELQLPNLNDFQIVSRQVSQPVQFSFNLGSQTGAQVKSTMIYQLGLRALHAGTFNIKPAKAIVNNATYESNPVSILINPPDNPSGQDVAAPVPGAQPSEEDPQNLSGAKFNPTAFLQTVVTPTHPYVDQQVDVTIYLYVRAHSLGQILTPSGPSMDGFLIYDKPITDLRWKEAIVNGVPFRVAAIHRAAAFPQKSGKLTLGTPKVAFDSTGGNFFNLPERVERTGVPIEIDVQPLPQHPGEDANAVTGDYTLQASLDQAQVQTADAITLTVTANGHGNVQNLKLDLPPIKGIRQLQPVIRDNTRFNQSIFQGERTWKWILIPQKPGTYTIPSLQLPYFDPIEGKYGVATTQPLTFTAIGEPIREKPTNLDQVQPPELPSLGPLRTQSALERSHTLAIQHAWFRWMLALPPALFVLLTFFTTLYYRYKGQKASSNAVQRKLLYDAHAALQKNNPRVFYDKIVRSITHALDRHLPEHVGGLPHAQMRLALQDHLDANLIERIIDELEGADFARFAASGVSIDEMNQCYRRTMNIIEQIVDRRRNS